MNDNTTGICDECGSEFNKSKSKMLSLCPECAHLLYGYENCDHVFRNGKCVKCLWNKNRSKYLKNILEKRFNMKNKKFFYPAEILLPEFADNGEKMNKYAVIACDQFTSEPEYWEKAGEIIGGAPSTLDMILPEVYLDKTDDMIPVIHKKMEENIRLLKLYSDCMIYCERTLPSNGKIRHGIIGKIDLEDYEYVKGGKSLIRSSEATVVERIPPRVKVRRGALLELPHVMVFYNDETDGLISYLQSKKAGFDKLYDFDLMQGSGNIKGFGLDRDTVLYVQNYLTENCVKDGLGLTVGDGNHSLASAKAYYEEMKAKYGKKADDMPCRYALVEIVNIHDEAIEFEPIYRLIKNKTVDDLINELCAKLDVRYEPTEKCFKYDIISDGKAKTVYVNEPKTTLPVAELQAFLDAGDYKIDYIHGLDSINALSVGGNLGIIFEGMKKSELFPAVINDGALPRKTFSMGEAKDKRFYLEARKIK